MKLIILSAGKGERLWPLTRDKPKSLVEVAPGVTLLDMQISRARSRGIREIVVMVGYRAECIEAHLKDCDPPVRTEFNPFFDVSNNLITAWLARHEMNSEFVLLNGDVIFHAAVLDALLAASSPPEIHMVVDRKPSYDEDDMKVVIDGDRVLDVGKGLLPQVTNGESIGMIRFSAAGAARFAWTLDQMVRDPSNRDVFYLAALQRLMQDTHVGWVECQPVDWAEVDFHPDVTFVTSNLKRFDERIARWK